MTSVHVVKSMGERRGRVSSAGGGAMPGKGWRWRTMQEREGPAVWLGLSSGWPHHDAVTEGVLDRARAIYRLMGCNPRANRWVVRQDRKVCLRLAIEELSDIDEWWPWANELRMRAETIARG